MVEMQTLDEFLADERLRLQRFEKWWRDFHAVEPDKFPMSMDGSDWDEAMMTFSG
jgi:hypothetical protein